MNNRRITTVIKDRALEKLDNFEDVIGELKYLSYLDEKAYQEVADRFHIVKNTTGYATQSFRHNLKLFLRTLVGRSMHTQSYFTASSMQTMHGLLGQFGVKVDYSKHKEANVLILLGTGVYLLASVNAPERSCKTYLSDKDTTMQVDVVDIMKVTQQSVCWCEL